MRRIFLSVAFSLALVGAVSPASALALGEAIEGSVTPLSVAGEVEVCLVETGPNVESCANVRPDGTYRLPGVPVGKGQRVVFLPPHRSGYVRQYYDHAARLSEAKLVFTNSMQPVQHIDADLVLGATIGGQVTAEVGGQPLPDVEVCASAAGTGESAGCAKTDEEGFYLIPAVLSGSYVVYFRGDGESAAYAPEYYQNQSERSHATAITIAAGENREGVNAALSVGAKIEGRVTAAGGAGLEGTTVCLFSAGVAQAQRCISSLAGGAYSFPGLLSGEYTVGFDLGNAEIGGADPSGATVAGFLPQFYRAASTRAAAQNISLLAPAVASGIDASLAAPPAPPAPPPPTPIAAPIVAAPPPVSVPPTKKGCKKGFHKKKAKGKTRCVKNKPKKHGKKKHGKKHPKQQKAGSGGKK